MSTGAQVQPGRARVAQDCRDALSDLQDGMTVAVGGGLNVGHPMALVRALMQRDLKDLTLASGFGSMELDMLVGWGCVRRLIASFVGTEGVPGLAPLIRWACERNCIEAWDIDEGLLLAALRAAGQKVPYTTWRCGMGTDAAANPLAELATDAADGLPYLKVRPLPIDACLYWAEAADEDGNVLRWGVDFGDIGFLDAARLRIVQVERIVPTRQLRLTPDRVAPWQADVVVAAPLGTYPFAGTQIHDDLDWLGAYMKDMAGLHKAGDWDRVRPALAERLRLDGDDHAFLEAVGVARLRELMK